MEKTVIVTGGASGMGRAVVSHLAEKGYFVYSLDVNRSGEQHDNVRELTVDVCSQESIDKAYETISSQTDELYAVINFAGIIMMNSLVEITEADFTKIFNVNLFGAYRINKTFLPLILKNKGKIIVTTSELAPNKIIPFNSIYSVSKKALDAYAEGLRMELGLLGVKVITLRPGAVSTNLLNKSNSALDKFVNGTELYKDVTANFKRIVDSEQGAAIPAEKIAKLVYKILESKHPKYVYSKNVSKKLKLLNGISTGLQLKIYNKLLKK